MKLYGSLHHRLFIPGQRPTDGSLAVSGYSKVCIDVTRASTTKDDTDPFSKDSGLLHSLASELQQRCPAPQITDPVPRDARRHGPAAPCPP
jgi:hypothetical protein